MALKKKQITKKNDTAVLNELSAEEMAKASGGSLIDGNGGPGHYPDGYTGGDAKDFFGKMMDPTRNNAVQARARNRRR